MNPVVWLYHAKDETKGPWEYEQFDNVLMGLSRSVHLICILFRFSPHHRALELRKVTNNLIKFSWDFYEDY